MTFLRAQQQKQQRVRSPTYVYWLVHAVGRWRRERSVPDKVSENETILLVVVRKQIVVNCIIVPIARVAALVE